MINSVVLMGRLTKDPELRHTNSGTAVCSFSIAVNNGYGETAQTDFINCTAWSKTAEFVSKYFDKGKMIALCGRLHTSTWEENGKTRYKTEVIAREVTFCGSKSDGGENGAQADEFAPIGVDDDMPF